MGLGALVASERFHVAIREIGLQPHSPMNPFGAAYSCNFLEIASMPETEARVPWRDTVPFTLKCFQVDYLHPVKNPDARISERPSEDLRLVS